MRHMKDFKKCYQLLFCLVLSIKKAELELVSLVTGWNIMLFVWGMMFQYSKSEHCAPCHVQMPLWYDWEIVESDIEVE